MKKNSSITQLVKFSWNKTFDNFKIFFDVAFIPFFLVLILNVITTYNDDFILNLFENKGLSAYIRGSASTRLVDLFLVTPLVSIFLVNWHRYVIFNGKKPWRLIKFDLSRYTFVFIWAGIKIAIVTLIPFFLLLYLNIFLFAKYIKVMLFFVGFIYALLIFVYCRLIIILPAAAAENDISLKRIFNLSKGNFWKIFLLFLLMLLTIFAISFALAFIFPETNLITWFLYQLSNTILLFVFGALFAGCISKLYLELKK
jgi:hypothetical protein